MAAVCVQAIWTASAPSISSFGAAASIIASAALMESSEIPPKGERARSLYLEQGSVHEVARRCTESFIQPPPPIFALAVRRMDFCQLAIRPPHLDTELAARRRWPATGVGELFGLCVIRLYPLLANDCTRDRSHLRSSMASAVQFPLRKFPFLRPRGAPGLNPPCKRHRLRPRMAGRWHAVPARVSAPHRGARLQSGLVVFPRLVHGVVRDFFTAPSGRARRRTAQGLVTARIVCREQRGTLARNQSRTKSTDSSTPRSVVFPLRSVLNCL